MAWMVPVVGPASAFAFTLNVTFLPLFRPFRCTVVKVVPFFFRALTEACATELALAPPAPACDTLMMSRIEPMFGAKAAW
jgi:hypothetical protein